MPDTLKKCSKCGVEKPLDQFRVDRGYVRGECRECARLATAAYSLAHPGKAAASSRKWCRENPEQHAETRRRWYALHKGQQKATNRLRMYGLTNEQYTQMLAEQGGVCAICKETCRTGRGLAVDHNHETGAVRGLLCGPCNSFLGFAKDRAGVLRLAADYVESRG